MGNNGSMQERLYLLLPVIMFSKNVDWSEPAVLRTIRTAYAVEQVVILWLGVYFLWRINKSREGGGEGRADGADTRVIFVPATDALSSFKPPPPEESRVYRPTTYFEHEMQEALSNLRSTFIAAVISLTVHVLFKFNPVLLIQVFLTPYNLADAPLMRKYIFGLREGVRVWGEMFSGEISPDRIVAVVAAAGEGGGVGEGEGGGGGGAPVSPSAAAADNADTAGALEPSVENAMLDAWDDASAKRLRDMVDVLEAYGGSSSSSSSSSSSAEATANAHANAHARANGWTPIMIASALSSKDDGEAVVRLLRLGASPVASDEGGWTALHWAAQHDGVAAIDAIAAYEQGRGGGEAELAKALALKDFEGRTPLELAEGAGSAAAAARLRERQ